MTCIIGIAKNGKIYMGGDSFVSGNGYHEVTAVKKVFRTGQFLIGYAGSTRMGNILRFNLFVEKQGVESNFEYMVTKFIPAVRKLFKDAGFAKIDNNVERGGKFLVGYKGILYCIDADFQVEHFTSGFSAVGSGTKFALGAIQAVINIGGIDPVESIEISLDVAGTFDNYVGPPYYVEEK